MFPISFGDVRSPFRLTDRKSVHIYTVPLNGDGDQLQYDLTVSEQERAAKLRIPRVRHQFIAARGHLRRLLGHYLGCPSVDVPILRADGGKPYLPPEADLHFNISHTDGLAVYAISKQEMGIDVERERPVPDLMGLVKRFFSPREYQQFGELQSDDLQRAFFRAWTRKEAVLKALGRGVQSLDCCEVTFTQQEQPRVIQLDNQPGDHWQLECWQPSPEFHAALAICRVDR